MITDSLRRRTTPAVAVILILLAAMMFAGCTTQPAGTPTATPTLTPATTSPPVEMKDMHVYNETANGTTAKIPLGGGLIVRLVENPSTGYSWNATVTPGLAIVSDAYEPGPQSQGMVGAPGSHSWILSGKAAGEQKFSAVYMRPWENVTGTENTFVLNVLVEKT